MMLEANKQQYLRHVSGLSQDPFLAALLTSLRLHSKFHLFEMVNEGKLSWKRIPNTINPLLDFCFQ